MQTIVHYDSKYSDQLSVSQQPAPDYEDVHHIMHSLEHDKHILYYQTRRECGIWTTIDLVSYNNSSMS